MIEKLLPWLWAAVRTLVAILVVILFSLSFAVFILAVTWGVENYPGLTAGAVASIVFFLIVWLVRVECYE